MLHRLIKDSIDISYDIYISFLMIALTFLMTRLTFLMIALTFLMTLGCK